MKKKYIVIVLWLVLIAMLLFTIGFLNGGNKAPKVEFSHTEDITVTDGVAKPEQEKMMISIKRPGKYVLHAEWEAKTPGLLTGCMISDEDGEIVFQATAESCAMDSVPLKMEAGNYILTLCFLASEEDYINFWQNTNSAAKDTKEQPKVNYIFAENGQWEMEYSFVLEETNVGVKVGILLGTILGVVIAVLIRVLTKRGDTVRGKYDERQEMARGKAAKYAFFSMFICNMILAILVGLDLFLSVDAMVLLMVSGMLGITIYVSYCIWNDAYFALNDKRKSIVLILVILGIYNLSVGINAFWKGIVLQNGQLTIYSLSFFCGIMMLVIGAVMLLKKICKDGKDE